MAQVDNVVGITPCTPILEQYRQTPRFFGALCQDIQLTDDAKYFNKEIETKRFIFKSDSKYDESTQEKYLLGIDSMSQNARK